MQNLDEVLMWLQMSMTPKGPCQSGYYCPNSSAIIPCPPGQFCKWWTKEPKVQVLPGIMFYSPISEPCVGLMHAL